MIFVLGGGRVQDDMETRHLMLVMVSLYRSSPLFSFLVVLFFFFFFFFSRFIINICIVTIHITVFLLPFLTILLSSTSTLPPWDLLLYLGHLFGVVFFFLAPAVVDLYHCIFCDKEIMLSLSYIAVV